jgi:ribosomal protein L11 methylase PrmA
VPYRVDVRRVPADAFDRLVDLGALDADVADDGSAAAVMPDSVAPAQVAHALGGADINVSPAVGRDADSVWVLGPRPLRIARQELRLLDSAAFGTGLHPTTALCLDALEQIVATTQPEAVLDVGTGSGVLALAALRLGVPRALGIDIDDEALRAAAENARLNACGGRLRLARGGPETLTGTWPLVMANVLAAPLIEMAPALVRRLGHQAQLVLSGIPASVAPEVDRTYRDLGLRRVRAASRAGWSALIMQASW